MAERPGERRNILRARRLQRERKLRAPGSHSGSGTETPADSQCPGISTMPQLLASVERRGVRYPRAARPERTTALRAVAGATR